MVSGESRCLDALGMTFFWWWLVLADPKFGQYTGIAMRYARVASMRPAGPGSRTRRMSEKPASLSQEAYSGSL